MNWKGKAVFNMNGYCIICGKQLVLTSEVNNVCQECNRIHDLEPVIPYYIPTDPITFAWSHTPAETSIMLAERKIKAYEEIIGYLVRTKQMYGSKKKLHSSAYALSDAINLIWKDMKLHCYTIKDENGFADIDMRFEDIIKMFKEGKE